jgi:ABC-type spermidine/putrescine transport system permease subunit II
MRRNSTPLTAILMAVLVFMVAPIVFVVVNSFNGAAYGAWPPPSLSLRWYRNLAQYPDFAGAAWLSLGVSAAATVLALLLGVLAAVAMVRYRFPGKAAVRALLVSPLVVPKIAIGLGVFILALRLGVPGSQLSLVAVHTLLILPFVVTIVAAGLFRVDPSQEEAARDLGASAVQAFLRVVVPQVRRPIVAAAVLAAIISFDEVDATIFVAAPDRPTLPVAMYVFLQKYQDPTLAALSTVLIVATVAVTGLLLAVMGAQGLAEALGGRRGLRRERP